MKVKIDVADSLFSKWIRRRDKWQCQRCLRQYEENDQRLQNSHFYGRSHENTRFEPDNCDALCYGCHQYFTSNPGDYAAWKLNKIGQKRFDSLTIQANTYKKKDRKMERIIWRKALESLK